MSGTQQLSVRKFVGMLAVIAAIAFAGRALYTLAVARHTTRSLDELYYLQAATNLAEGGGFKFRPFFGAPRELEFADHPPLTSLTLAPIAWLTDSNDSALRLTVALVGTGTIVLIGFVGREVAGARVGLAAAGVASIYPNLWANDGLLMSEAFAAISTAATILCSYRLIRRPTWSNAAWAGMACGLAMLSRAELALLVPLVVLPVVLTIKSLTRARRVRLGGVVLLAATVMVLPWVAYNLSRFEKPVFLSTGDGSLLSGANCNHTYYGSLIGFWHGRCGATVTDQETSIANQRRRDQALEYIHGHLSRLPVVMAARVGRVWSVYKPFQAADLNAAEGRPAPVSLAGLGMYWLLVGAAIAGLMRLHRCGVHLVPLVGPLIMVTVIGATSYGMVRFRVPAEVSIIVLATVGFGALIGRAWSDLEARPV